MQSATNYPTFVTVLSVQKLKTWGAFVALLALGYLQVFGAVRAYLCACAPDVRAVRDAVCVGETCHPHHLHQDAGNSPRDAAEAGPEHPTHRHITLHDGTTEGTPSAALERLDAPASVVCWSLDRPFVAGRTPGWSGPCWGPGESPPLLLLVVQSTVRLI